MLNFLITAPAGFSTLALPLQMVGYVLLILTVASFFGRYRQKLSLISWLAVTTLEYWLYVGLRFEAVPNLTMPIWWILLGLIQLAWFGLIIWRLFAVMKKGQSREQQEAARLFRRYLPKAKR